MQIRIFGKELFSYKSDSNNELRGERLSSSAYERAMKRPNLPDFHNNTNFRGIPEEAVFVHDGALVSTNKPAKKKKPGKEPMRFALTPKGVYMANMLNAEGFEIKVDKKYLDSQIADFKRRLGILNKANYDMSNGEIEVASILMRLQNRKKYATFRSFYDKYPYTLTSKIEAVLKVNTNLKLGQVEQFVPDLPKEAIDAMKDYDDNTKLLCDKKAVYYIIADQKDFKKSAGRRDPILLAQSPFGHFWQILGAWDKEMLLLEEL